VQASSADVALKVCVEAANQNVFDMAQATGRNGMGATLTALLFHGGDAYIAEVGDSRAYLVRGGRMVQLTRDQSYVQVLLDAGALTQEESETSKYKNIIVQAMGLKPNIQVVLNRISIRRRDRFLLCSDGLSGTLKYQEILDMLLGGTSLDLACSRLIETAVERGAQDDITVILAEVHGEGAPPVSEAERLSLESSKAFAPT
jgi:serine/threonine protein phosphatase PrpC